MMESSLSGFRTTPLSTAGYGAANGVVFGIRTMSTISLHTLSRMAGDSGFHMKLLNPLKIAIDDNIKAVLTKRTSAN